MYGVLGEDSSDAETIKAILTKLVVGGTTIKTKGFGGKDKLLQDGLDYIRFLQRLGYSRFVVCHDSDDADPSAGHCKVLERVVKPSGVPDQCCIMIPVHAIEAWILADIQAVTKILGSWKPEPVGNPESIADPKKELRRLSKAESGKLLYNHVLHNEKVARHLDLETVAGKCPSFRPLLEFVKQA